MIVPLRNEQGTDELLKDRKKLTDLGEKRHNKEFINHFLGVYYTEGKLYIAD